MPQTNEEHDDRLTRRVTQADPPVLQSSASKGGGHPRAVEVRPLGVDVEREFKRAGKALFRWRVLFDAVVREVESLRRARRITQRISAEKARTRTAQLAMLGVTSVDELIAKYQAMAAPETKELQGHVYTRLDLVLAAVRRRETLRAELLQLVREALQAFEELRVGDLETASGHVIDLRDWEKSARAAIAKAEGYSDWETPSGQSATADVRGGLETSGDG